MFKNKIKAFVILGLNGMFMAFSWVSLHLQQGDEYLPIFLIPLIFIVAPFMVSPFLVGLMVLINLIFLTFYTFIGIINPIDVFILFLTILGVAGSSYLIRSVHKSFIFYNKADIRTRQCDYNNAVNELDVIDRRGRKIETELARISRLYEITKKLAPALKFKELLDALLGFLEENFHFNTAHLLVCADGEFSKGISKDAEDKDYYGADKDVLDYKKVVDVAKEHDYKMIVADRSEEEEMFEKLNVRADTLMIFPMFAGEKLCAILAIEGAARTSFGRFRILISQIALEFRKVELYEKVQALSIIDGLTEVYLRRYLMDRLEEEVERAGRLGLTFSIGMVDVDKFKNCNDQYGHLVGDAVLRKIADRLKGSVREVDLISRYGGEEFCIMLPETSKKLALTVAERLRRSIEKDEIKAFDEMIKATVSVGISTYPEDGTDVNTLIEKADTGLYKAKRQGRNRVCTG